MSTTNPPFRLTPPAAGFLGHATTSTSAYAELHCASAFSLLRAGSSVEALVARAAALDLAALALTDYMTLAGIVRFQVACAQHGLRAIVGCELAVADPTFVDKATPAQFVVLAENRAGYAALCRLLTDANLADPDAPVVPFAALGAAAATSRGLIVLTGGRDGALARLLLAGRRQEAMLIAARYRDVFGPAGVFVELQHHHLPDGVSLMRQLAEVAAETGLRCVATNGVAYATRDDYALTDLLTCVRLGITVDDDAAERPRNDEAHLQSAAALAARFDGLPWGPEALAASVEIAGRCDLALLRGSCTAPHAAVPAGCTAVQHLRTLCEDGLVARYIATEPAALAAESPQRRQLAHELAVIATLELEEFFLCVADIMRAARAMGIRVSGRGSAANSLVAYVLRITGVDPIRHRLLFERFLNPDRQGMPDVDMDVQSDRREELIRYVERTYTHEHAAMVANVITYRPRLALRDAAKALGFPLPLVNRITKVLHHHSDPADLPGERDELERVLHAVPVEERTRIRCLARLPLLLTLAARLCGLPRHLSLHNGGMILTREPLPDLLPIRVSANGVRALEVDKDDAEHLGLIKFDLLGLRTLGAMEEALTLIEETTGTRPDLDALPTDPPDPRTMRMIRAGQTLAVFQIESPGQWHLLAQTQPETFDDLIVQTALFRPGPIQGGFVHPYVIRRQERQGQGEPSTLLPPEPAEPTVQRQRRGRSRPREAVQTPWQGAADDFWTAHPVLGNVLRETEGILLFQEQILAIAHHFAGLSYAEADGFRRAMSHARTREEMEAMRGRFLAGALAGGERREEAIRVFDAISQFVGYGFCRSHAAEFARTIYATAWLKAQYPAHYLAAFLSSQPAGFFPPATVLHEARLLGIPVLPPDVNRSEARFSVERVGRTNHSPGHWAIRIGLAQVAQVGEELAEAILWERRRGAHAAKAEQAEAEQTADAAETESSGRERPFTSLADVCRRLRPAGLTWPAAEALVLAGACDGLRPHRDRRRRLWELHELWPLLVPARRAPSRQRKRGGSVPLATQLSLDWELAIERAETAAAPQLPALDREEHLALDYQMLGLSAGAHPMQLRRRELRRQGVRTITDLASLEAGRVVHVAGWPISAQRPPTAKGMGFLVLEDETGRLPVALPPQLAAGMHRIIRDARVVVVTGRVEHVRWYRSLLGFDIQGMP